MKYAAKLIEKFSGFPFGTQVAITLGCVVVLVVVWSAMMTALPLCFV